MLRIDVSEHADIKDYLSQLGHVERLSAGDSASSVTHCGHEWGASKRNVNLIYKQTTNYRPKPKKQQSKSKRYGVVISGN